MEEQKTEGHIPLGSAISLEDITPTPSRTGTPRRSVLQLRTLASQSREDSSEPEPGESEGGDSSPSKAHFPPPEDVYDSLLSPKLVSLSATGSSPSSPSYHLESPRALISHVAVQEVHMPSSGDKAAGRSHDDGRAGAGAGAGAGASSSSDPARSHGAHRQQQHVQSSSRRLQGRPPIYATPPQQYYPSSPSEVYQNPTASAPPPQPPAHAPSYPSALGAPSFQQRGSFIGQYTMSPQPAPPPQSMFSSQHQYGYPPPPTLHHPSMHSPDSGLSPSFASIGYSTTPLAPPGQARTPMYPYTRYSPEGASTSSSSFPVMASAPPEHASAIAYDPSPPSGSPHPSHSSSPYPAQHASPSFPSFNYPTLTTTPQFPHYSRESFPHSAPYQPQYSPYTYMASPSSPEEAQHQGGTWWYIPQGASASAAPAAGYDPPQRQYQGVYPIGGYPPRPDLDAYGNPTPAATPSGLFPSSPTRRSAPPSSFSGPSSGTSHPPHGPVSHAGSARGEGTGGTASSRGPLSAGSGRALAEQSGGESGSERGPMRRSFHPNPPTPRSDWVMWVGNVPSDATHDELWRFFKQSGRRHPPRIPSTSSTHSQLSVPQSQSQTQFLPAGLLSPEGSDTFGESGPSSQDGVASVFLISRSNCAFVNYATEAHLQEAVRRFNGLQLRPGDPRCPRLVCRVRGKDDDLRAGVGGQRGTGIHTRHVKELKEKERAGRGEGTREGGMGKGKEKERAEESEEGSEDPPATPSDLDDPGSSPHALSFSSSGDSPGRQASPNRSPQKHHSSSSGSYASTTSSFLSRHFPKRYFILKSLTQHDLNLSVEKGVWATQPHNEEVLNQAFRSSTDVYLIFGVNKSGEFFGYAKMLSPIGKSGERISWASRTTDSSHSPTASLSSAGRSWIRETIPEEGPSSPSAPAEGKGPSAEKTRFLFSPDEHRAVEESPQPVTPFEQKRLDAAAEGGPITAPPERHGSSLRGRSATNVPGSAPAEMHGHHRKITIPTHPQAIAETFDTFVPKRGPPPKLDPQAPIRAIREQSARGSSGAEQVEDADHVKRKDTMVINKPSPPDFRQHSAPARALQGSPGPEEAGPSGERRQGADAQWGTPFKVQWIRVGRLPFYRTRHLRNPWNHDREVKVSRDGTELEPLVGQALLDEWDKPEPVASPAASPTTTRRGGRMQARGTSMLAGSTSPVPQQHQRTQGDRGHS